MIAVLFEVEPNVNGKERYFEIATELKAHLGAIDGFISIERFQSLSEPNRYLSLSFWANEEAVKAWRNQFLHREAQNEGRHNLFKNYRIRVAHVLRDYSMHERDQTPLKSTK